jgi:hypothetical protein
MDSTGDILLRFSTPFWYDDYFYTTNITENAGRVVVGCWDGTVWQNFLPGHSRVYDIIGKTTHGCLGWSVA